MLNITTGNKDANHFSENGKYIFFTCSMTPLKSNTYSFDNEAILLPGNGANVGKSIYFKGKFEVYQRTYVLENKLKIFQNILFYKLIFDALWINNIEKYLIGSAIPYIKYDNVWSFLFPLPPLAEQKRIVEKFNEIEPLINLYEQYEQSLSKINDEFPKQLEKSILQYAIQGKLVKQNIEVDGYAKTLIDEISKQKQLLVAKKEIKQNKQESFIFKGQDNKHYEKIGDKTICIQEEIPFEIPSNWEWVRLKTISEKITDGTHKTPNYVKYGIPFLSVQNISKGKFNFKEIKYITKDEHKILSKRVNPRIGDILMCRIGTLGKAIINNLNFNFSILLVYL